MKLNITAIKTKMAEMEYTGRKLAQMAGLSSTGVSSILHRGSCSIPSAGKIARALGVELETIMKEE